MGWRVARIEQADLLSLGDAFRPSDIVSQQGAFGAVRRGAPDVGPRQRGDIRLDRVLLGRDASLVEAIQALVEKRLRVGRERAVRLDLLARSYGAFDREVIVDLLDDDLPPVDAAMGIH